MWHFRQFSSLLSVLPALLFFHAALGQAADTYPSKPVTIIVPHEAAGIDTEMRMFAQSILDSTGVRFIVDRKGGAGGTIGTTFVARSSPDGYTILAQNNGFAITPFVYPDLPYDYVKDFAPVILLTKRAYLVVVHPSAPFKTATEYVAYARAHPEELNFGTSGVGSSTHLPGALLHYLTNTKTTFVHYKKSSDRLTDVMAGRVHAAVVTVATGMPTVRAGKFRAIAVTTDKRVPSVPDIPTLAEQGVKGFEYTSWTGVLAPGRVPQPVITKLNAMWVEATRDPAVIKKLETDATIMMASSPEEFRTFIAAEAVRYRQLIKEAGIKVEVE